nr:glycosyltransferase [Anaerolinea sp.]
MSLTFWGCKPPDELADHPSVIWNDIHYQSYVEFADYFSKQICDIFIAPLSQNEFNRAKSPLKYLEYSSLGVSGVYSKIDPYEGVIQDGKNGLLAAAPQDWFEKIEALVLSPTLRLDLANAAQQAVARDWLLSNHHALWSNAIDGPWVDPSSRPQNRQILGHITEKTQQQVWEMERTISSLSQEVIDLS